MNMKKLNKLIIVLVTMLLSVQSNAVGMKEASWYLNLDVHQLTNNEFVKYMHGKSENNDFDIKQIPKEIDSIIMYGDSRGSDDATVVINGDFSQFSIYDFALDLIYKEEENAAKFITEKTVSHSNHDIQVLTIKDEKKTNDESKTKDIYFAAINNDMSVVGLNLDEVKSWIDNNYSVDDLSSGSIFSVLVNVESALAHMGMNLDKNSDMLHSEIFKKVSEVSASVREVNDDMVLEVALTAVDAATATQLEQIISGLIAMNNLSGANDENQLHAMFMQNLNIEKNGNVIVINTFVSMDELKNMDIHQHLSQNKGLKAKLELDL